MNKKINKILACVDFSKYSLLTLGYALEFANKTQSRVMLLNVINQRDISGVEMGSVYFPGYFANNINVEEYAKDVEDERYESLKQLVKKNFIHDKSLITLRVDIGIPSECILKTVEAEDIDLIVMSNKGRGNISRFLFGSTAEKVFRHSPVPVVSVRDKMIFKRED
jgi:nucleotide-binding universal stress UspA family protein